MKLRPVLFAVCAVFAANVTFAQITVGRLYPEATNAFIGSITQAPFSYVDAMHPATGNGNLTRAVVRWIGAPTPPCTNAFKLKFLRPTNIVGVYSVATERGPFTATSGRNEVLLSPAVPVNQGDLIGVTQVNPAQNCGGMAHVLGTELIELLGNAELAAGSGSNVIQSLNGASPAIFATSEVGPVLVSVLPVAGATAGSNGSFFRTSLQLTGTDLTPLTGTIVYHPAGKSASPDDPSTTFTVGNQQTVSFPDIAAALGQTGIGSIDILTSGVPPIVSARVFNDLGAGGTLGFTEEGVAPLNAQSVQTLYLHMPSDIANFRMNIGVRTLNAPVTVTVARIAANGTFLASSLTRNYPANYFEQTSAQVFADTNLVPDGMIRVQVGSGKAIIYATVTDNRTNDSSIQFANPNQ